MRITVTVEDMMSLQPLYANSKATCIRPISVGQMVINQQGLLPLLFKVGKDVPAARTVSITRLDNLSSYICSENDILLMNKAADAFDKNVHKHATFHANPLNRHANRLHDEVLVGNSK